MNIKIYYPVCMCQSLGQIRIVEGNKISACNQHLKTCVSSTVQKLYKKAAQISCSKNQYISLNSSLSSKDHHFHALSIYYFSKGSFIRRL